MLAHDKKSQFFLFHLKIAYHTIKNEMGFLVSLKAENDEVPCSPRGQRKRRYFS